MNRVILVIRPADDFGDLAGSSLPNEAEDLTMCEDGLNMPDGTVRIANALVELMGLACE